MKHVVCYSGGEASALVAIEVVRRFGNNDVILVNHDITPDKEDAVVLKLYKEVFS